MSIDINPEGRKRFIDDLLKKKGLYVNNSEHQTEEAKIFRQAESIWNQILKNVAKPLLKAIPDASKYDIVGTQKLLLTSFQSRFNTWSKEELVFLISVMHAEEIEKQIRASVEAGICGEHMDKPI